MRRFASGVLAIACIAANSVVSGVYYSPERPEYHPDPEPVMMLDLLIDNG